MVIDKMKTLYLINRLAFSMPVDSPLKNIDVFPQFDRTLRV